MITAIKETSELWLGREGSRFGQLETRSEKFGSVQSNSWNLILDGEHQKSNEENFDLAVSKGLKYA